MPIPVKDPISALLKMVKQLEKDYQGYEHKNFRLEGRLIGDIGEILVAVAYDITLNDKIMEAYASHYSGHDGQKRPVQIKATMHGDFFVMADPQGNNGQYLAIEIDEHG